MEKPLRNVEELAVAAGGTKIKSTYGLWKTIAAYFSFMLFQTLHKILADKAGSFFFNWTKYVIQPLLLLDCSPLIGPE